MWERKVQATCLLSLLLEFFFRHRGVWVYDTFKVSDDSQFQVTQNRCKFWGSGLTALTCPSISRKVYPKDLQWHLKKEILRKNKKIIRRIFRWARRLRGSRTVPGEDAWISAVGRTIASKRCPQPHPATSEYVMSHGQRDSADVTVLGILRQKDHPGVSVHLHVTEKEKHWFDWPWLALRPENTLSWGRRAGPGS